jgi:hypothetical protein
MIGAERAFRPHRMPVPDYSLGRHCPSRPGHLNPLVAVTAIGTLPLPVMHRSIVIHMERRGGRRPLTRLDKEDPDTKADLTIAYRMMLSCREMLN